MIKINYRPPKELRALFIVHYMPLLLIILLGPLTPICKFVYNIDFWTLPLPIVPTILTGMFIF
ncbi:MAG TPA: hypothetical protein ENG74_00655, partial [Thermoplasmatales archaeon]|nr:hypothetical protein [Thermoplasmatales archaeon]